MAIDHHQGFRERARKIVPLLLLWRDGLRQRSGSEGYGSAFIGCNAFLKIHFTNLQRDLFNLIQTGPYLSKAI